MGGGEEVLLLAVDQDSCSAKKEMRNLVTVKWKSKTTHFASSKTLRSINKKKLSKHSHSKESVRYLAVL